MKTKDFHYDLPEELIAQDPLEDRSASRLLVLDKDTGDVEHTHFRRILDFVREGDCLVRNDTRVIPARLMGRKEETGAAIECLLLRRREADVWECLVKPGRKAKMGTRILFGDGAAPSTPVAGKDFLLEAEVVKVAEEGVRWLAFRYDGIWEEVLEQLGETPLPPYITKRLEDGNRYQTVYAKYDGSVAAPTAGLHFTEGMFAEMEAKGVRVANVTLHVGLGTFRPVKVEDVGSHVMHSEFYEIRPEEADKINRTKAEGGNVICVGTTSCRAIESAADGDGYVVPGSGDTDIFIYPGYRFRVMNQLITNFHLPESTLLMLISALAGRDNVLAAYRGAVERQYRFFSFGDCMFIK